MRRHAATLPPAIQALVAERMQGTDCYDVTASQSTRNENCRDSAGCVVATEDIIACLQ